jgi:ketosteroid isomerase-like protein
MSERNIELIRRATEKFMAGEPAWELLDPEVEIHDHDIPDADVYRGHEGFVRWVSQWADAWEDFRMEPEEFIDAGDKVVLVMRLFATGKGSGVPVERQDGIVYTMGDGRMVRIDYFNNRADALAAAGL